MNISVRPLRGWPREGGLTPGLEREKAQFRSKWEHTEELLGYEAHKLGGDDVVIEVAVEEKQISVAGRLKRGVVPRHPGVVVTFDTRYGPRSIPRDKFLDWRHNVHAVARTLEYLRGIDRWDSKQTGEQYEGYRPQLEAGPRDPTTPAEALAVLQEAADVPPDRRQIELPDGAIRLLVKSALFNTHPDRGGSEREFGRVQKARELLKVPGGSCGISLQANGAGAL